MNRYVAPDISLTAFNCPHCGAYASQKWSILHPSDGGYKGEPPAKAASDINLPMQLKWITGGAPNIYIAGLHLSACEHCKAVCLWVGTAMIYPLSGSAPMPNTYMPEDVRLDYLEASAVMAISPKAAAALLRLALQKLCLHLGGKGRNINDDIAVLVSKGLEKPIQQALDIVRVVGNESVHPGQIDVSDDRGMASALFRLLNLIVEKMIETPREVDELYALLPEDKRAQISVRDKRNQAEQQ